MTYNIAQRNAIYKWREGNEEKFKAQNIKDVNKWRNLHKEEWNETQRATMQRYYEAHKEERSLKNLARYYYRKEVSAIMMIGIH